MHPSNLISELSAALRDVIAATPEESRDEDPGSVYRALACRLIVRLAPVAAIVPKEHSVLPADRYERMRAVSNTLIHSIGVYTAMGCDRNTVTVALIDAYVRLKKAEDPSKPTEHWLLELKREIDELREPPDSSAQKIHEIREGN